MLPADEWDHNPNMISVLKPMIINHLVGARNGYTAKQIIDDMGLLEQEPFMDVEATDVLKGVEDTLRVLEEDGQLQSKRPIRDSEQRFYRPVPRIDDR